LGLEDEVEELRHGVEVLEQLARVLLSRVREVRVECSVPRVVLERRLGGAGLTGSVSCSLSLSNIWSITIF